MDPIWQDLQATFRVEVEERARELGSLLLQLEKGGDGSPGRVAVLAALYREAHSLKGAAQSIEVTDVERVAHAIESALSAAQRSDAQPDPSWFDAVYRAIDILEPLCRSASTEETAPPLDFLAVIDGLLNTPPQSARFASDSVVAAESSAKTGSAEQAIVANPLDQVTSEPIDRLREASAHPRASNEANVVHLQTRAENPVQPATAKTVRVAVSKLDSLLALAGELSVSQIRIKERLRELRELRQSVDEWRREWRGTHASRTSLRRVVSSIDQADRSTAQHLEALLRFVERADQHTQALFQLSEAAASGLAQETAQLELVSRDVESEVMSVRLVPVASIVGPLERLVRDLAREQGKVVDFVVAGGETELDRKILENLRDPLMHMLRNSVDHGLESPERREDSGKPRSGVIRLAASQRGGMVVIEVEDDGIGLDPRQILASAVEKRLLSSDEAADLDDRSAIELIFRPGFSTRATVTETSGRGVGMDVVREHVEGLNGQIRVESVIGQGSHFHILIPLTLATTRAILVEHGGQIFGIPSATVERTSRIQEQHFTSLDGSRTLQVARHAVPAVDLGEVLQTQLNDTKAVSPTDWKPYFVVGQGDRRVAILVDRLVGEQEVMIKSLGWPLRRVPNVSGAALLGSGQIVIILNPADLVVTGWSLLQAGRKRLHSRPSAVQQLPSETRRRRILVVDDSLTARTLVRSILEAAGYDVVVAGDGVDALITLRNGQIDLVVSDVDMPRQDGFALTADIRRDQKLRTTPVVLVTSFETPEHRERGVAAGADAYIVKSGFDQGKFLETVSRLL